MLLQAIMWLYITQGFLKAICFMGTKIKLEQL